MVQFFTDISLLLTSYNPSPITNSPPTMADILMDYAIISLAIIMDNAIMAHIGYMPATTVPTRSLQKISPATPDPATTHSLIMDSINTPMALIGYMYITARIGYTHIVACIEYMHIMAHIGNIHRRQWRHQPRLYRAYICVHII